MGNTVSQAWENFWPNSKTEPFPIKGDPGPYDQPTFDPMLGFPNGRKVREMNLTHEQLRDAHIPREHRDYCAPQYIELKKCYRDTGVLERYFFDSCHSAVHKWNNCQYSDMVHRYKEYERERRLRERQRRRIAMGLEEDPNAPQMETQ